MARSAIAATAAAILATANAQWSGGNSQTQQPQSSVAKQCVFEDICYSLNLPTSTFTNGGGTLFFQISGPDTYSWIGLGQGGELASANMFIIYADGEGNVTLSPRLSVDDNEVPKFNPDAKVTLLSGSGVQDGKMVANVRCDNCNEWQGGSMDLKADIATWIGAVLPGAPLDSKDPELQLEKAFVQSSFPWPMAEARGGESPNPFAPQTTAPQQGGGSGGWGAGAGANQPVGGIGTPMAIAHGVLASVAFIAFFPSGAIVVRLARFRGVVWLHAAIQLTGYALYVAAAGLGIRMMLTYPLKYYRYEIWTDPHPKIGMALLAYLFLQPISGFINHFLFGKKGHRLFSHYIHIWGGRLAILLGFINGGFGLRLGQVSYAGYKAAYGLCATVMGALFILNIALAEKHRDAPNPSLVHAGKGVHHDVEAVDGEGHGEGHVRMDSMEERERLHAAREERAV